MYNVYTLYILDTYKAYTKHINGMYSLNQYIHGIYMEYTWFIVGISRCVFYITGIFRVQRKRVCLVQARPPHIHGIYLACVKHVKGISNGHVGDVPAQNKPIFSEYGIYL